MAGITAENYLAKRLEMARKIGGYIELTLTAHKDELNAWLKYFCLKAPDGRTPGEGWGDRWKEMLDQIARLGAYLSPVRWPWQFDADVTQEQVENQWLKELFYWTHPRNAPRRARPETTASALAFYRDRGVEHLDFDHPDRRKATVDWKKKYLAQLPKAPKVRGFGTVGPPDMLEDL